MLRREGELPDGGDIDRALSDVEAAYTGGLDDDEWYYLGDLDESPEHVAAVLLEGTGLDLAAITLAEEGGAR